MLFGPDISGKKPLQLGFPLPAPRVGIGERFGQRATGIDGKGVDPETGAFFGKPRTGPGEAKLGAYKVYQISAVSVIEDREGCVQREQSSVKAICRVAVSCYG